MVYRSNLKQYIKFLKRLYKKVSEGQVAVKHSFKSRIYEAEMRRRDL